MKRFKLILTIRYDSHQRKRHGIKTAKTYEQTARYAASLVTWQTDHDRPLCGEPVSVAISIREIKPKAAKQ